MAQRKPPTTPASRKPPTTAASRKSTSRPAPGQRPAPAKRQPKKPGKSIVNQKQTPWALITTVAVVVVFAAAIIVYAATRSSHKANATSYLNELSDAKAIPGVTFKQEASRNHIASGTVSYDSSPPVGGNHSGYWADCSGTVYAQPIANENAVHMLEHGAVWITYKPGLAKADVDKLAKLVNGQDRMALSPYPGLKTNVSLQSWGYQLFVNSASDPRIQQFVDALRYNPKTTPEYGASCSQPTFKQHPSTFGHPLFAPVSP